MSGFMLTAILLSNACYAFGKDCLKNTDIGWEPGNIYECNDPDRPECCEIRREFVCCENNTYKNTREQVQLWGTVLLFCMALYVVYLYFHRDSGVSFPLAGLSPRGWCSGVREKLSRRKTSMDFRPVGYFDSDLVDPPPQPIKGSA